MMGESQEKYQLVRLVGQWFAVRVITTADCSGGAAPLPIPIPLGGGKSRGAPVAILLGAGAAVAILWYLWRRRSRKTHEDKSTSTDSSLYSGGGEKLSVDGDFDSLDGSLLINNNAAGNSASKSAPRKKGSLQKQATIPLSESDFSATSQSYANQSSPAPAKPETDNKGVQTMLCESEHITLEQERLLSKTSQILSQQASQSASQAPSQLAQQEQISHQSASGLGAAPPPGGSSVFRGQGNDDPGTDLDALGDNEEVFTEARVRSINIENQDVTSICKADMQKIRALEKTIADACEETGKVAVRTVETSGSDVTPETRPPQQRIAWVQKDKDALATHWTDLRRTLYCTHLHLQHASQYQMFHYEVEQLQSVIESLAEEVKSRLEQPRQCKSMEELRGVIQELEQAEQSLAECGASIERLCVTSKTVPPVHMRTEPFDEPHPVEMICGYENDEISLDKGEVVLLTSNNDPHIWECKLASGDDVKIPAMCILIPSPDINTMKQAAGLEACFKDLNARMRELYTARITMLATYVVTQMSQQEFDSISASQQEELMALVEKLETFIDKYLADSPQLPDHVKKLKQRVLQLIILEQAEEPDEALEELLALLRLWVQLDSLYGQSMETAKQRRELVRQGTLLDSEETEWETLAEVVEARRQRAHVSITMDTETAHIGAADQYEQATSETKMTFTITGVKDTRDNSVLSYDEAIRKGIIDQNNGIYNNMESGESYPIPVAMNAGFIIVEHKTEEKSKEYKRSVGVVTVEYTRTFKPYNLMSVLDPVTHEHVEVEEAQEKGLIDLTDKVYTNTHTGERMTFNDAVDSGALIVEYEDDAEETKEPEVTKKTFAISWVLDRANNKRIPLDDAIDDGIVNKETGIYIDTRTREELSLIDAMQKQYVRGRVVEDASKIDKYMARMRSLSVESWDGDE